MPTAPIAAAPAEGAAPFSGSLNGFCGSLNGLLVFFGASPALRSHPLLARGPGAELMLGEGVKLRPGPFCAPLAGLTLLSTLPPLRRMSLDIGRRLRRGAGDGALLAAAAAAVAARAAFSSSCLAYSSCAFFFFQYPNSIPPATAISRTMTPTAMPIFAPVERPEPEDVEAWLEAVAEAAATSVLWLAVEN